MRKFAQIMMANDGLAQALRAQERPNLQDYQATKQDVSENELGLPTLHPGCQWQIKLYRDPLPTNVILLVVTGILGGGRSNLLEGNHKVAEVTGHQGVESIECNCFKRSMLGTTLQSGIHLIVSSCLSFLAPVIFM